MVAFLEMTKNKALYIEFNGSYRFIGKHIKNNIIREFPFAKAVLWQNKSFSFDKKLLDYAKQNAVENFVFADLHKNVYLRLSMNSVLQNGSDGDYGYGLQWYVPMSVGEELETYKKSPYVSGPNSNFIL